MVLSGLPSSTYSIGRKAGASLLHAVRSAAGIGRPLDTLVTINMGQLGSTEDSVFHDFAQLRGRWFRPWSANTPKGHPRNGPPTYTYVHENETGLPHTHWLVHVHPLNRVRFERQLVRWLTKFFKLKSLPAGTVQVKDAYNPEGFKLYMAKNLDSHFAKLWKIRWEEGGRIAYRRADVSRNIGPAFWKAQKAAYKASLRRSPVRAVAAAATATAAQARPPHPSAGVLPATPTPARLSGAAQASQSPQGRLNSRCSQPSHLAALKPPRTRSASGFTA